MANNYIRRQFSDTVSYTDQLSGGITNSALSFTLKDGSTFPTGGVGPFVVTIDPNLATEEKVLCASRSGATVTVQSSGRGFGGTTAVAHSANASVIHTLCGQDLDEANQAVVNTIGKVTTAGDTIYASGANAFNRLAVGSSNQVMSSSGTAPQWSTLLALMETQFTAANQILWGTGNGTGALIALLTAIEDQFSAANQVILGTGNGTGALTDIGTAVNNKFGAAGDIRVGTGSATGELLSKGSAGTSLTVGGADPSGLQWQSILGLPLALTGATAATRYVGATASGAPGSGTFAVGDFIIDQSGAVWVCTGAGTPGTWVPFAPVDAIGAWTSFTPTWSASGVAPAIGNGSLVGAYRKIDRTVAVRINLTAGSTTTYGTGTYTFALPFTAASNAGQTIGLYFNDNTHAWGGNGVIAQSGTTVLPYSNSGGSSGSLNLMGNTQLTSANQVLQIQGVYESTS